MAPLVRFLTDTRGGAVERIAVMAGAIALASVGGAHMLQLAGKNGGLPKIALVYPDKAAPAIDYTPTGSIRAKAGQTVLDPCTGKPK